MTKRRSTATKPAHPGAVFCPDCGANLALVGRHHRCVPRQEQRQAAQPIPADPRQITPAPQPPERNRLGQHGGDRRSKDVSRNQPDNSRNQPDNVSLKLRYGNSRAYAIARLDRDRPDLAVKVRAGSISAHAGAIAAGFRRKHSAEASA